MRLKIFSDPKYIPEGALPPLLLTPFADYHHPIAQTDSRFSPYFQQASSLFELTSLEDADIAVLPVIWENIHYDSEKQQVAFCFVELVQQAAKPIVVFYFSDDAAPIPIDNATIFQTSLYESTRKPGQFALPAYVDNFVEKYLDNQLPVRQKTSKPVVGFCGEPFIPRSLKARIRKFFTQMGLLPHNPATVRTNALRNVQKSRQVTANFILRTVNWFTEYTPEEKNIARREYVRNMVDSDYVLCTRGRGNYSYRLYETLSCGRIPIFVNTDCVLPLDMDIDWKQYVVWVEAHELPYIGEKIADFHANISDKLFIELQHACHDLWKTKLSPEGFLAHLYRHFPEMTS